MFANPVALLMIVVAAIGAGGGLYAWGRHDGRALELAERATQDELVRATSEAAQSAAAIEISKIKVTQTTIAGKVERVVVEKPVYRDCVHDAVTQRLLNDALTNSTSADPIGGRILPGADASF